MSFAIPQPRELGLSKKEKQNYSLLNALGHIQKGNWINTPVRFSCVCRTLLFETRCAVSKLCFRISNNYFPISKTLA